MNIDVNCHSSIRIEYNNKIIYVDPFKIDSNSNDADYIFITHSHYDHLSMVDIKKIVKDNTKFVIPINEIDKIDEYKNILGVEPNKEYVIDDISFSTVPSYNTNKEFHKKEYGWLGYIFNFNKVLYIAGDTDDNEDIRKVKCDIAMVPIGGVYTMNYEEAAEYINYIKPEEVIPIHYGTIVGNLEDGKLFSSLVDEDIKVTLPY